MINPDLFLNPSAQWRPMPFWFWNTKLRSEQLLDQVRQMHEKGCGGFFVHARFGLETEYLSDEWFGLIREVCELARELEMEVWLYDEESFPSGLIGGRVTQHEAFRSKFVDVTEVDVEGPEFVVLELPAGSVSIAQARGIDGKILDLTSAVAGNLLHWQAPAGTWRIAVFSQCTLHSDHVIFGVDYTSIAAMDMFFTKTMNPYADELGEYFGSVIKGIFTDEPTLLPWHHDSSWYQDRAHNRVAFWTPRLAIELENQGYDADAVLTALFFDEPEAAPLRRAYYEVALVQYEDTFFKPYRAWCDAHGLEFTGHLLLEEGLYNNSIFQADPSRTLRHMHRPGADHLGLGAETPYGGGNLFATSSNLSGEKLVASVAAIEGANRVMTESFGCGGWGMTLEHMKRTVDWQWSLGLNFLCPHALFGSIEGFRKTDAPPCPLHNTQWEHYRSLTDYVGRLSYALTLGKPVGEIALVYPLEAFQEVFTIGVNGGRAREICDTFDFLCAALARLHVQFDIVPRWALEEARPDGDTLRVGEMNYNTVVWPFASEDELHQRISNWVPVLDVDKNLGSDMETVRQTLLPLMSGHAKVTAIINDMPCPDIRILRRTGDAGEVIYLANVGEQELCVDLTLPCAGPWILWDPETGTSSALEVVDNMAVVKFAPLATCILSMGNENSTALVASASVDEACECIDITGPWNLQMEGDNSLPLNPMQFSQTYQGMGQEWRYNASFEADFIPEKLMLVFDDIEYRFAAMRSLDITIRVNTQEWHQPEFDMYRWPELKALNILNTVKIGHNEVEIIIRHQPWQNEPLTLKQAPVLVGSFAVQDNKLVIPPTSTNGPGSWTEIGLALYSGVLEYVTEFELPANWAASKAWLEIENLCAILEVEVNGECAGKRCWRPWKLAIGSLLRPGKNILKLKITNTIGNFMDQKPMPSGLLGKVQITY